jgi:hypothetical protein
VERAAPWRTALLFPGHGRHPLPPHGKTLFGETIGKIVGRKPESACKVPTMNQELIDAHVDEEPPGLLSKRRGKPLLQSAGSRSSVSEAVYRRAIGLSRVITEVVE